MESPEQPKQRVETAEVQQTTPEQPVERELSAEEVSNWAEQEKTQFISESREELSKVSESAELDEPTIEQVKTETNVEQSLSEINDEGEAVIEEAKKSVIQSDELATNPESNHSKESAQEYEINEEKVEATDQITLEVKTAPPTTIEEKERSIESQANYQGYWDDALHSRLNNDSIKQQFLQTRMEYAQDFPIPEDTLVKSLKSTTHLYMDQINNYDQNLEKVFSYAKHEPAKDSGHLPKHLGYSRYGEFATLFSDAVKNGKELTDRQKNIIFAHELGHSIRNYKGEDIKEIRKALDYSKMEAPGSKTYLKKPEEVIERMSQLKNYFGMQGSEKFTKEHLRVAKENYLKDTELDNNMTDFFNAITPETEDAFIEVINKFGV